MPFLKDFPVDCEGSTLDVHQNTLKRVILFTDKDNADLFEKRSKLKGVCQRKKKSLWHRCLSMGAMNTSLPVRHHAFMSERSGALIRLPCYVCLNKYNDILQGVSQVKWTDSHLSYSVFTVHFV